MEPPQPLFDSAFLAKLEALHLLSRKIFRGQNHAERRSRQTGSSMEFADYRNYTPGDDLRLVDWNIYGRLNRLFIKLFEAEQDLHVSILLDASASMRWQPGGDAARLTKFDHACRIAAALAYISLANLDRVNIFAFSTRLEEELGFLRGKGQFHKVLEFLRRLPQSAGGEGSMQAALQTFTQRMKRRGLVFVLSDFFDPQAIPALGLLRQHRFEAVALQVVEPCEIDPALEENWKDELRGDLRLNDIETGATFDVQGDASLLTAYRQTFAAFVAELEQTCNRKAIGFLQTTTALPFEELVLKVLRERQMVR